MIVRDCLRSALAVLAFGAGALATPAFAGAISISDTTLTQGYQGTSPSGGPVDVLQSADHLFDTGQVVVTVSSAGGNTSMRIQYYTQFDGNDPPAGYADIFIGTDPSNPDTFDHAIALGAQGPLGFYDVSAPGSIQTSIDKWKALTNFIYGGQYQSAFDGLYHDAPTVVTGSASVDPGWSVVVNNLGGPSGNATFPNLVDVQLTASTLDFLGLFGNGLSLFWGTGDCGNDAIDVGIPSDITTRDFVPEPFSITLFGGGLMGVLAMRRRRNTNKSA